MFAPSVSHTVYRGSFKFLMNDHDICINQDYSVLLYKHQ